MIEYCIKIKNLIKLFSTVLNKLDFYLSRAIGGQKMIRQLLL